MCLPVINDLYVTQSIGNLAHLLLYIWGNQSAPPYIYLHPLIYINGREKISLQEFHQSENSILVPPRLKYNIELWTMQNKDLDLWPLITNTGQYRRLIGIKDSNMLKNRNSKYFSKYLIFWRCKNQHLWKAWLFTMYTVDIYLSSYIKQNSVQSTVSGWK